MILVGIVIRSTGSWAAVRQADGTICNCRLKGNFRIKGIRHTNPLAAGDRVVFESREEEEAGLITQILPRHNYIIRRAVKLSKESHIIAANIDQAWLVVTLAKPVTSNGFIDRFLVTAEGYHITSGLVFNKTDLYNRETFEYLDHLESIYTAAGYPCVRLSALTGEGVKEFRGMLGGKVNLFSGHSGAGKSALIKALDPSLDPRIGKLSDAHNKGKHTTTFAEMYGLDQDTFIIDTPGIKEFGLVDFNLSEIPRCFPEMDRFLPMCSYSNCSHTHEPGCAVKEALENGGVSRLRYNSYLSIINDSEASYNR